MEENRNRRKLSERGKRKARARLILRINLVLVALLLLLCMVLFVKSCSGKKEEEAVVERNPILENSDTFYGGIYVEEIPLEGMTIEEAKNAVLAKLEEDCKWDMKIVNEDKVYEVEDILSVDLGTVLEDAFLLGREGEDEVRLARIEQLLKEPVYLTIEDQYDASKLDLIVEEAGDALDTKMENADLIGYDAESGEFQYSDGKVGYELNKEVLKEQITQAIENGQYDAKIQAQMETVPPEMDRAAVKERVQLIGTFVTTTTSNADRNENIRLASLAVNGVVVKPGEEFSMNDTTGPRELSAGYKPAGTIVNGKLVEEPGGGVCQVSTTLYNALIKAGLKTTERYSHSLQPSYITPGEDAMISYSSADLKFINNSTNSVVVLIRFQNNQLTASVYGVPVLEDGVTVEMESEIVETIPMPKPVYEEDSSLKYGEEVTVTAGKEGIRVSTYLVKKKDGQVISREFFHNSTYNAKAPVIKRNSKAKPEDTRKPSESPKPTETPEPEESLVPEEIEETQKPAATKTPAPAKTLKPTETPVPTPEPTVAPSEPEPTPDHEDNGEIQEVPTEEPPASTEM